MCFPCARHCSECLMYINFVLKRILCSRCYLYHCNLYREDNRSTQRLNNLPMSTARSGAHTRVPLTYAGHHIGVHYFFFPSFYVFLRILRFLRECLPLENVISIWRRYNKAQPQSGGSKGNKVGLENPSVHVVDAVSAPWIPMGLPLVQLSLQLEGAVWLILVNSLSRSKANWKCVLGDRACNCVKCHW